MGNSGDLSYCGSLLSCTDLKICGGEVSDHGRVLDWEDGLPSGDDLTPLSFHLVPPSLASAFRIPPADLKTVIDVQRATQITISSLNLTQKPHSSSFSSSYALDGSLKPFSGPAVPETGDFYESRLPAGEDSTAAKRPRLVWSPQLHKRFVDAVSHLGIKKSVPKTIMELMNVEGLTRENVASHLQKYRLYLKRIQGFSEEAPSPSAPVADTPQKLCGQQQTKSIPVQYTAPIMIPMPIYAIPNDQSSGLIPLSAFQGGGALFHGFEAQDPYRMNN